MTHGSLWSCMFIDGPDNCAGEYFAKLGIVLVFALPNLLTTAIIGVTLALLVVFVALPYVPLIGLGMTKATAANLVKLPPNGVQWFALLPQCYWSVSGFTCISTLAGEFEATTYVLPRSLKIAGVIMFILYVGPMLVAGGVDPNWQCWEAGSMSYVGGLIGGSSLGIWVLLSQAVANWGLFSAQMIEGSFQLQGMAEVGIVPRVFRYRHPVTGAAYVANALQLGTIALLTTLDFSEIITLDTAFSSAAVIVQYLALLRLRFTQPRLPRPHRIPLSNVKLCVFYSVPIVLSAVIFVISMQSTPSTAFVVSLGILISVVVGLFAGWHPSECCYRDLSALAAK